MSAYVVRWIPVGPEIKVACQTYDEAIAIRDELRAIGRLESVTIEKDNQVISEYIQPKSALNCIDQIEMGKENDDDDATDISVCGALPPLLQ